MEKKTSEKMLFIRCKQTGFATLIPEREWNKYAAKEQADWDVSDPDAQQAPIEDVAPVGGEAPVEAAELTSAPTKKADKA